MLTKNYLLSIENGIKTVYAKTLEEVKELVQAYNRALLNVQVTCFWYNSETNTCGKYILNNI